MSMEDRLKLTPNGDKHINLRLDTVNHVLSIKEFWELRDTIEAAARELYSAAVIAERRKA